MSIITVVVIVLAIAFAFGLMDCRATLEIQNMTIELINKTTNEAIDQNIKLLSILQHHSNTFKGIEECTKLQNEINGYYSKGLNIHTERLDALMESYSDILFILSSMRTSPQKQDLN